MSPEGAPGPLAVVTGAGVRVGRAIAVALAGDGFDVVVHAHRSSGAAQETARAVEAHGRRAYVERADLGDDDGVDAFAARVDAIAAGRGGPCGVDVLVHSAAAFEKLPFADIDRARYRAMQRLNLEAPFFLTQRLMPALERAGASSSTGGPCVVHVADIAAERPVRGYAHYSVSKAGVVMLTKALAVELAPRVRVNAVAPGTVAFPPGFTEAQRASVLKRVPMQREGTPEDVARAVVFLARSPYVTGAVLPVDGGRAAVL